VNIEVDTETGKACELHSHVQAYRLACNVVINISGSSQAVMRQHSKKMNGAGKMSFEHCQHAYVFDCNVQLDQIGAQESWEVVLAAHVYGHNTQHIAL
jgi:hypothetical protein